MTIEADLECQLSLAREQIASLRAELGQQAKDNWDAALKEAGLKESANRTIAELRAELTQSKRDVNTLNELLRAQSGMGQGEINHAAYALENIDRVAEELADTRKQLEEAQAACCEMLQVIKTVHSLRMKKHGRPKDSCVCVFCTWNHPGAPIRERLQRAEDIIETIGAILEEVPELNMNNYDEDDVSALNQGMIQVFHALNANPPDAGKGGARGGL